MSLDLVRSLKWDEKLWDKPRERCTGPTAQSHNSCRFAFFCHHIAALKSALKALSIYFTNLYSSTLHRCISPHQAVLETVVKMSEAFRKTQPKGIWLYAGTTHWLFSMQNKMQRKPIWDALATFLLTTQMYGLISKKLSYSITEWMYVSIHHTVWREIVQISAEKTFIISLSF